MLGSDPTAQPRLPLSLRLASFRRCAGPSCDHGKVRCGLAGGPAVPAGDLSGAASAHTRLYLDPPSVVLAQLPGHQTSMACWSCPLSTVP